VVTLEVVAHSIKKERGATSVEALLK